MSLLSDTVATVVTLVAVPSFACLCWTAACLYQGHDPRPGGRVIDRSVSLVPLLALLQFVNAILVQWGWCITARGAPCPSFSASLGESVAALAAALMYYGVLTGAILPFLATALQNRFPGISVDKAQDRRARFRRWMTGLLGALAAGIILYLVYTVWQETNVG